VLAPLAPPAPKAALTKELSPACKPRKARDTDQRALQEQLQKMQAAEEERQGLQGRLQTDRLAFQNVETAYCQSKSNYIETMRELQRFRDEFNDLYSLRSKIKHTQQVCQQVGLQIAEKEAVLTRDKDMLSKFKSSAAQLFDEEKMMSRFQIQVPKDSF